MADRGPAGVQTWEGEMFRLLVENVKDYAIFVVDPHRHILSWSKGAERLLGFAESEIIGERCDRFFTPDDVRNNIPQKEIEQALTTGRGEDDRWHQRKDGTRFWCSGVVTPLKDEQGTLRGFAKIMRDRTDLKRAEEQLRRVELRRSARLVIAQALAEATSVEQAASLVLNAVCEGLNWDVGALWALERQANVLRCVEVRSFAGATTKAFEAATREARLQVNTSLPGRVWHADAPLWIPDVVNDSHFQRAAVAAEVGLHGAFACPIRVGNEFLGVIEFFSKEIREPDPDLLEMMTTLGGQIGQFMDRQRTETALRHSEERFRSLMEQAPFSIQVFSPEGRTIRVNRAWEELWGVRFEQIEGYNVLEDRQLEARGVLQYIHQGFAGRTARIPAIQYDPNETIPGVTTEHDPRRWLSAVIYPIKDAAGQVQEVVLIHEDITARHRAEEALRKSERLYRAIGESIDYGVWVCDPQGRNIYASESFLRLVGLTQAQCSEFGWGEVLHPEDAERTIAAWKECVRRGSLWDIEHRFRGVDGRWHFLLARGVPVRDEQGEITAWAGINLDISRLKQVEQELREVDRRKDEFLATLAHELRNPLAPIRNSLQILKLPGIDADIIARTRDMMERQVHHLVRLVDDLLDVSRVMRGKIELRKERIELATVIARAVETTQPLIDAQGHELSVDLPVASLPLDADPVRLSQVVSNLLTNAAKYMERSGRIWLTARREGATAVLRVRDAGIGIDPDDLPRIFELFVQVDHSAARSQGGLGIGLTLVKNLVEMHGGSIEASSPGLGRGSEFIVRLPLAPGRLENRVPSQAAETRPDTPSFGHRVLVVDDNRDAAESLALMLRLQGHEVRVAHDGPHALALLQADPAELVFLDIGMPGMDGYEVARRLRQQPSAGGVLLIALTGWGTKDDRRRSLEAGFNDHLVKPVEPSSLERLLANLKPLAR